MEDDEDDVGRIETDPCEYQHNTIKNAAELKVEDDLAEKTTLLKESH